MDRFVGRVHAVTVMAEVEDELNTFNEWQECRVTIARFDGFLADKASPEMVSAISGWMNQLQRDRHEQAVGFVRSMFKKPQTEQYLKSVTDASIEVPADTAVVLIYNMIAVKDFSAGLSKMNKPVLFAYQPDSQQSADFLKSKLGDKVQLERFEGDGHALFVDEPDNFNRMLEKFVQSLPR